jgi:hypothetical protein
MNYRGPDGTSDSGALASAETLRKPFSDPEREAGYEKTLGGFLLAQCELMKAPNDAIFDSALRAVPAPEQQADVYSMAIAERATRENPAYTRFVGCTP